MGLSRVLILEGVTGTGKSSILREIVSSHTPSFRVVPEERTLSELMSDAQRWDGTLPVTFPQAEEILAEIRADVSPLRRPPRWILEQFHPTYYTFFPHWDLYAGMDTDLHDLGARMILLSMDPECMPSRILDRLERAGTEWIHGMVD